MNSNNPSPYRNWLLLVGFLLLQMWQLAVLPLVLLPASATWGWLLLVPLLLSNSWWAYIHEALHGHLFADKRLGRAAGRLNAVLFGAAFDLLRYGHLLHHAHSRTQRERAEVYRSEQHRWIAVAPGYYFRLLGGLYVFEILGSLMFLLPERVIRQLVSKIANPDNVVGELTQRLLKPETLRAVRVDTLAIITMHAAALYWYGDYWWMLVGALSGRGALVSLMDNAFHYGTPLDAPRYAPNLAAPRWWSSVLLNFNLHGMHHQKPAVPWHRLASVHQRESGHFEDTLLRAILVQFRGPIPEHALPKATGVAAAPPT